MDLTSHTERADASSPIGNATIGSVVSSIRALRAERSVLVEIEALLDRELEGMPRERQLGSPVEGSDAPDPEAVIRVRSMLAVTVAQIERRIAELESMHVAASRPPDDRDADHAEHAVHAGEEDAS